MVHTTIETPTTIYTLIIEQSFSLVELTIAADNLTTQAGFALSVTDDETAEYFSNYLAAQIASHFQQTMAETDFLSRLQDLISTVLVNWQSNDYQLSD